LAKARRGEGLAGRPARQQLQLTSLQAKLSSQCAGSLILDLPLDNEGLSAEVFGVGTQRSRAIGVHFKLR
jgi:hypothetical protein